MNASLFYTLDRSNETDMTQTVHVKTTKHSSYGSKLLLHIVEYMMIKIKVHFH